MNRKKTVLVISDRYEQFAPTASILQDDGYDVRFETTVNEGLKLTRGEAPYLIISELAVPNVDGLQLCRRTRSDQSGMPIPVLLVGDLSKQSSIVEDGFRCGARDYLQKPIDAYELADKCRLILAPDTETLFEPAGTSQRWKIDKDLVCTN